MPKSSALSLTMRPKGGKESSNASFSPRSPNSPNPGYGNDLESAMPTASYHTMPTSPSSPKHRKDSKSIFSNFHATRSSSRIAPENSIREVSDQAPSPGFYSSNRNGSSTPDLQRPIVASNFEGNASCLPRLIDSNSS